MNFEDAIAGGVEQYRRLNKSPIRIVAHLDSDGISACSILIKALKRERVNFVSSIVKQIDDNLLKELKSEPYKTIFFIDLGSGYLDEINEALKKNIFILDHHKPERESNKNLDIIHLNPHLYGVDGNSEISGAGIVYLFCKALNEKNIDLAYLAVIGAIGDMQENKGFIGLNQKIVEDAVASGKIEVKNGLRMFGMQTKPLYKVLEYSTDPYIPNVTGNEEGAKNFLEENGITLKGENGKYKKLIHLNEEDMKKLVTAIILKRLGSEEKPEDVLGPIYLLTEEEEENPTKDAKEFSTLLNACGRMNKPSYGIGTCLGNKRIKRLAGELLIEYKKEIINSLNWFYNNKSKVAEGKNYIIINAEDNIKDTLIGTLSSIISKSNVYREGTIIIGLAHTLDDDTKVSARIAGFKNGDSDLRKIMKAVVTKVGGFGGGHKSAAGALIPQEKEIEFIDSLKLILDKEVIEESVQ